MDTLSKRNHLLLALLFAALAQLVHQFELVRFDSQVMKKSEPSATPWDHKGFKFLTQGEWITGLDLLWLRDLQDPRIDHVKKGEHPWTFYDFDLITDFDPAYGEIYLQGAMSLIVIRDDISGGLHLLEKANKYRKEKLDLMPPQYRVGFWEEGYFIPFRLAYTYLFEMDDITKSAEYYREAAAMPGSPPYIKNLIKRFDQKDGLYEVGIKMLGVLANRPSSPEVKEKFVRKFDVLSFKLQLRQLNEEWLKAKKAKLTLSQFLNSKGIANSTELGGKFVLTKDGAIGTEVELEKVLGL